MSRQRVDVDQWDRSEKSDTGGELREANWLWKEESTLWSLWFQKSIIIIQWKLFISYLIRYKYFNISLLFPGRFPPPPPSSPLPPVDHPVCAPLIVKASSCWEESCEWLQYIQYTPLSLTLDCALNKHIRCHLSLEFPSPVMGVKNQIYHLVVYWHIDTALFDCKLTDCSPLPALSLTCCHPVQWIATKQTKKWPDC